MYGDGDFFTMKGVIEEFLEKVGMHRKPHYDPSGREDVPASGQTGKCHL